MNEVRCWFNACIECTDVLQCENCGWNPEVAADRKRKLLHGGRHALVGTLPRTKRKTVEDTDESQIAEPEQVSEAEPEASRRKSMEYVEAKAIVRMNHRDFGIGTMGDKRISKKFGIGLTRINRAKKELREELKIKED